MPWLLYRQCDVEAESRAPYGYYTKEEVTRQLYHGRAPSKPESATQLFVDMCLMLLWHPGFTVRTPGHYHYSPGIIV